MLAKTQTWLVAVLFFIVLPSMRFWRMLDDEGATLSVSSHPRAAAMNISEVAPLNFLLKTCGMADRTKAFVAEVRWSLNVE